MTSEIEKKLYHKILQNMPIACVDVVIRDEKGILLVKRRDPPAKGQWWIPGGRVLKGEKLADAAHRKALQEVGLNCRVRNIIHTAETIFPDGPKGIPVHSINTVFLLDNPVGVINLDSTCSECMWVKAVPQGLHKYVRDCLRKVI
jgi:colanic acid biosynthesis protein WcaH